MQGGIACSASIALDLPPGVTVAGGRRTLAADLDYLLQPAADGTAADDEWRFHAFAEGGLLRIYDRLPGQQKRYGLASAGAGTRFKLREHYNGSLDIAIPFLSQTDTRSGDIRVTFRGWAEF